MSLVARRWQVKPSEIHKITVRSRKSFKDSVTRETGETHISSSTSCSPSASPNRIRVILSKRSAVNSDKSAVNEVSSRLSDVSCSAKPKVEILVESLVMHLWNRDQAVHVAGDFGVYFQQTRSTALWYSRLYNSKAPRGPMDEKEGEILALASVFLAFKAADYIPGTGRVRMAQLIEAYEKSISSVIEEPQVSLVVDQICITEMEILCLSGFNFCPC